MASLRWRDLGSAAADCADGAVVTITGYPVSPLSRSRCFLLTEEAGCCPGCAPRHPDASVAVEAKAELPLRSGVLQLSGRWRIRPPDGGPRYQLEHAVPTEPPGWRMLSSRRMMVAGSLACMAAPAVAAGSGRAVIAATTTVDLHSHAGGIASQSRITGGRAFMPVAEKMRQGGMAVACLAVVSDGPTHKLMPDGRLHPYRNPDPNELYTYGSTAFARLHDLAREQGLAIVTDPRSLHAARAGVPSIVISAEGGDFLEGKLERIDEAYGKWALRHLQLTHYRVNELGDIQTEPPVHGGLTDTGAEVIRRCNRLGIVVDVAHGTYDLVKRAVVVTARPIVLSHTGLSAKPGRFSRHITPDHARLVAETGGVIGIWPPSTSFGSLPALAQGMARMADVVGVDHVGLGSDMRGLTVPSIFPDYDLLPDLADALLGVGFSTADAAKILGGNYARVFEACMV